MENKMLFLRVWYSPCNKNILPDLSGWHAAIGNFGGKRQIDKNWHPIMWDFSTFKTSEDAIFSLKKRTAQPLTVLTT